MKITPKSFVKNKLVKITWMDASIHHVHTEESYNKLIETYEVGWIISFNEEAVTLASCMNEDGRIVGGISVIPISTITKLRYLK